MKFGTFYLLELSWKLNQADVYLRVVFLLLVSTGPVVALFTSVAHGTSPRFRAAKIASFQLASRYFWYFGLINHWTLKLGTA